MSVSGHDMRRIQLVGFHRMFNAPVYVTKPTLNANGCNLGQLDDVRNFEAGQSIRINGVVVHTIPRNCLRYNRKLWI